MRTAQLSCSTLRAQTLSKTEEKTDLHLEEEEVEQVDVANMVDVDRWGVDPMLDEANPTEAEAGMIQGREMGSALALGLTKRVQILV